MPLSQSSPSRWIIAFLLCAAVLSFGQGRKFKDGQEQEQDHPRERDQWFRRGRPADGGQSAEKLHRAYRQKLTLRAQAMQKRQAARSASAGATAVRAATAIPANGATWTPLGPAPEASDASGLGSQDYGPVTGRATAVVVDQNDPTGGTVYLGGAYGGVWKSTNASDPATSECGTLTGVHCAPNVRWRQLIDDQPTLAVGAIALKPDNSNVVLVGTGESNSSADAYYGLGVLRSTDAGNTWTLITSAGTKPFRGLAFSRIAFSTDSTNVVVASTAAASGGITVGGERTGTSRGLYYSSDAGATWSYRASVSDGSATPDEGSAHSVVYLPAEHKFYAALRAHGIYSSSDGTNWTRLATQPGGVTFGACPTSPTNLNTCPLYRAEIAVVPGRNEMYVWMVDAKDNNSGIYQTLDGGSTWTAVPSSAIAAIGSEVSQGTYNLDLAAIPHGATGTDLYAGAVDQWKAILTDITQAGTWGTFINLTRVYECSPYWGSYSHVHPDEHSIDFLRSNPAIIYFANDGGIYRTLNGYASASGVCGTTPYPFDNLNSTMGSMTQYVWFTNHPTNAGTLLGGTQDNGSPATASAFTSAAWVAVNNADGGYNDIDPKSPSRWYTSTYYVSIERCGIGINCTSGQFTSVVDSAKAGGDSGSFYTPYMLDPQNPARIIVGTCRVWRGNSDGSSWSTANALSYPNFSATLTAACPKGDETNPAYVPDNISALAAGGPKSATSSASQVVWAGTEHGKVYVTTNADGGASAWNNRTGSINPGGYPISAIALDPTDSSGQTAYVTIMGFDVSHVFRTANAGQSWTDYTGDLPNAPADGVVVDLADPSVVYVATDVGVFATTNGGVNWVEVGLDATGKSTFPNVAITRLAIFSGGTSQHLRVSTYGRGVWDIDLGTTTTPSISLSIPDSSATVTAGQSTTVRAIVTPLFGFTGTVTFSCSNLPAHATCSFSPAQATLSGSEVTTTLTISTASTAASLRAPGRLIYALWLPIGGIALAGFAAQLRRRALLLVAMLWCVVSLLLLLQACGGGSARPVTPRGTYTITVTATAGSITKSQPVTLMVQ